MTNKKFLYLLIPAVIIIWGMIIYKIANQAGEEAPGEIMNTDVLNDTASDSSHQFFTLISDYKDPFENEQVATQNPSTHAVPAAKKTAPVIIRNMPKVVYKGLIVNRSYKKELALVSINEKEYILKINDVIEELKINKITKDSLVVVFNKQKIVIKK